MLEYLFLALEYSIAIDLYTLKLLLIVATNFSDLAHQYVWWVLMLATNVSVFE